MVNLPPLGKAGEVLQNSREPNSKNNNSIVAYVNTFNFGRKNFCNPQKFWILQVLHFAILSLIYNPSVKKFARRKIDSTFPLQNNDYVLSLNTSFA